MNELKPCPCCGSTARPVGSRSGINPHWKLCRVICDRCGLTTANHSTPEEAAAAWNSRAAPPRAEVDVEAVRVLTRWVGDRSVDELPEDVQEAWSKLDDTMKALARDAGGNDAT